MASTSKICPVMTKTFRGLEVPSSGGSEVLSGYDPVECQGEGCALWDDQEACCVYKSIALHLHALARAETVRRWRRR